MQMLLANIGWSDNYDGQNMDGPGYERWNFKHYEDGFLRGILRGQGPEYRLPKTRVATGWTVIFVARRQLSSNIVGFYQDCELLAWADRPEQEVVQESVRQHSDARVYQYNLKAPETSCFLIPTSKRPQFNWAYGQSSFVYLTEPDRPGVVKANRGGEYQLVHELLGKFPEWRRDDVRTSD